MSISIADISVIISLGAIGTAVYGIFERRNTAKSAERIRLTEIIQEMVGVRDELAQLTDIDITVGSAAETQSAKLEILNSQALNLTNKRELEITSAECRELALSLEQTGLRAESEEMWKLGREYGEAEGDVPYLYASRGYAYFLFRSGRPEAARKVLTEVLSRRSPGDDWDRLKEAETVRTWINCETSHDADSEEIGILRERLQKLAYDCSTSAGRERISRWALNPPIEAQPSVSDNWPAEKRQEAIDSFLARDDEVWPAVLTPADSVWEQQPEG